MCVCVCVPVCEARAAPEGEGSRQNPELASQPERALLAGCVDTCRGIIQLDWGGTTLFLTCMSKQGTCFLYWSVRGELAFTASKSAALCVSRTTANLCRWMGPTPSD